MQSRYKVSARRTERKCLNRRRERVRVAQKSCLVMRQHSSRRISTWIDLFTKSVEMSRRRISSPSRKHLSIMSNAWKTSVNLEIENDFQNAINVCGAQRSRLSEEREKVLWNWRLWIANESSCCYTWFRQDECRLQFKNFNSMFG